MAQDETAERNQADPLPGSRAFERPTLHQASVLVGHPDDPTGQHPNFGMLDQSLQTAKDALNDQRVPPDALITFENAWYAHDENPRVRIVARW